MSAAWGSCAVEIDCDTSGLVIPPSTPGAPAIYMGFVVNGTTGTIFRHAKNQWNLRVVGTLELAAAFPLPSSCIPTVLTTITATPLAGFSQRSLIG